MISKQLMLASILGDNEGKTFTLEQLRSLTNQYTERHVYEILYMLRRAGMNIEVNNRSATYKGAL